MTTLYVIAGLVVFICIALYVVYRKGSKAGGNQVVVETQKGALDAVEKAKDVEMAIKTGEDKGWTARVKKIGRRP